MADQTDFKHITVNPAEPDDIVIHAGAPSSDAQSNGEAADIAKGDIGTAPMAPSEGARAKAGAATASSGYHATTLEDIQGFKMSKTQIAVIIVALAAIAAFVVWYTVFS